MYPASAPSGQLVDPAAVEPGHSRRRPGRTCSGRDRQPPGGSSRGRRQPTGAEPDRWRPAGRRPKPTSSPAQARLGAGRAQRGAYSTPGDAPREPTRPVSPPTRRRAACRTRPRTRPHAGRHADRADLECPASRTAPPTAARRSGRAPVAPCRLAVPTSQLDHEAIARHPAGRRRVPAIPDSRRGGPKHRRSRSRARSRATPPTRISTKMDDGPDECETEMPAPVAVVVDPVVDGLRVRSGMPGSQPSQRDWREPGATEAFATDARGRPRADADPSPAAAETSTGRPGRDRRAAGVSPRGASRRSVSGRDTRPLTGRSIASPRRREAAPRNAWAVDGGPSSRREFVPYRTTRRRRPIRDRRDEPGPGDRNGRRSGTSWRIIGPAPARRPAVERRRNGQSGDPDGARMSRPSGSCPSGSPCRRSRPVSWPGIRGLRPVLVVGGRLVDRGRHDPSAAGGRRLGAAASASREWSLRPAADGSARPLSTWRTGPSTSRGPATMAAIRSARGPVDDGAALRGLAPESDRPAGDGAARGARSGTVRAGSAAWGSAAMP